MYTSPRYMHPLMARILFFHFLLWWWAYCIFPQYIHTNLTFKNILLCLRCTGHVQWNPFLCSHLSRYCNIECPLGDSPQCHSSVAYPVWSTQLIALCESRGIYGWSPGQPFILKFVVTEGLRGPSRGGKMGDQVALVTAMRKVHLLIEAVADIGIILSSDRYWEFCTSSLWVGIWNGSWYYENLRAITI